MLINIQNTIPSRIQFADSLNNLELVKSVHGGNVDALPWQHASLRAIHKALGVAQLWDSLFVFQPAQPSDIGYETIWKFDIDEHSDANIQVCCYVRPSILNLMSLAR